MDAFDMRQIVASHRENKELYHEFFSADRLSVGLYVLEAGATDVQTPTPRMRFITSFLGQEPLKLRVSTGRLMPARLSMRMPT